MDEQRKMDAEDDALFRGRLRRLRAAVETAALLRAELRSKYAAAIAEEKRARLELDAYLEADARPVPLFDRPDEVKAMDQVAASVAWTEARAAEPGTPAIEKVPAHPDWPALAAQYPDHLIIARVGESCMFPLHAHAQAALGHLITEPFPTTRLAINIQTLTERGKNVAVWSREGGEDSIGFFSARKPKKEKKPKKAKAAPPPPPEPRRGLGPDNRARVEVTPGQWLDVLWDEPAGVQEASGKDFGDWADPDVEAPQPDLQLISEAISDALGWPVEAFAGAVSPRGTVEFGLKRVRKAPGLPPPITTDHPRPVCWLPDGLQARLSMGEQIPRPSHVNDEKWALCLSDLASYPAWWAVGDDMTAYQERRMVKDRLGGRPEEEADALKRELICAWREKLSQDPDAAPEWGEWGELHVTFGTAGPLHAMYFGRASFGGEHQFVVHRPGISDAGQMTLWADRHDLGRLPEESVKDYVVRVAAWECKRQEKKAGRSKARPQTAQEARL